MSVRDGNKNVAWVVFIRIICMFTNGYHIVFVSVFSDNFPMNFYYFLLFPKHDLIRELMRYVIRV